MLICELDVNCCKLFSTKLYSYPLKLIFFFLSDKKAFFAMTTSNSKESIPLMYEFADTTARLSQQWLKIVREAAEMAKIKVNTVRDFSFIILVAVLCCLL